MPARHRQNIDDPWNAGGLIIHLLLTIMAVCVAIWLLLHYRMASPAVYLIVVLSSLFLVGMVYYLSGRIRARVSAFGQPYYDKPDYGLFRPADLEDVLPDLALKFREVIAEYEQYFGYPSVTPHDGGAQLPTGATA